MRAMKRTRIESDEASVDDADLMVRERLATGHELDRAPSVGAYL
jgi:hypothetical protein